jgi:hypothetical protein
MLNYDALYILEIPRDTVQEKKAGFVMQRKSGSWYLAQGG